MQLFTAPPRQSMVPTVIPDDVPVYRIKEGKFFCDDELYEAGSIIAYPDEPNLEMEPLNALALDKMTEFLRRLDVLGKAKAEKDGKAYISYEDAFKNAMSIAPQEGKRVTSLNGPREVPIMGGKKRGRPKASKIDLRPEAPAVGTVGKLSVNGRSAANRSSDSASGQFAKGED